MFTGLVETTATVRDITRGQEGARIGVACGNIDGATTTWKVEPGDSVAVNGVCLTLETAKNDVFYFTAVEQTLQTTTLGRLKVNDRVNLERALRADARLGGHFVSGHVDGLGTIVQDERNGNSCMRRFRVSARLMPYIVCKGSVAIDGISLTVAQCDENIFSVAFVPYTLGHTTMPHKKPGMAVNIECDILAKYVEKLVCYAGSGMDVRQKSGQGSTGQAKKETTVIDKMERMGY